MSLPINVYCDFPEGRKLIAQVASMRDVKLFFESYHNRITWNADDLTKQDEKAMSDCGHMPPKKYECVQCLLDELKEAKLTIASEQERMTFEKFSKCCDRTWHGTPPSMGEGQELSFLGLAINGEAGELAEHIKKLYRDDDGILSPERRQLILKELGDKLFYMDRVAKFLGSSLDEVAEINVEKLADRTRRGVRGGSGDNR